ncbi:hypothetical protein EVAR_88232_1 [Eumeta japonica]|uniref:Uncharacterized protein n=1 Tax=Eumeta variegata TaxID=151549 RepID=A0A4C1Z271_EUMVA|nr:hypothetical protein EVAR_88232_1 [Eumeta japonica]
MVDWDLVFIATLAEEEEKSNQSRRFWVNNLWNFKCEFNKLFNDLRYDVRKFYDYYRMSYENFESLVHLLRPYMEKKQSRFRSPIPVEERLSVCLRYDSNGDFRSQTALGTISSESIFLAALVIGLSSWSDCC